MFSDPASNLARFAISPGMKIGDIGAGSGFYSLLAAKSTGQGGRVYAIDVQKDLLDKLKLDAVREHIHNIEIVWGNAEKIGGTKLRESILDRIIVSNILFQLDAPEDFALEMKRILKSGGKAMIIDWTAGSKLGPQTVFPALKAQQLFEKNGFKLETHFGAGDHHYGLIFTKQ